jgi:hypothetical protein
MGSSVQKAFIRSRANRAEDQNPSQKAKFKPVKSPAARLPDFVEPMKAKLVDSMPTGDWIYEIKFDGYVAITQLRVNDWVSDLRLSQLFVKLFNGVCGSGGTGASRRVMIGSGFGRLVCH